MLTAPHASAHEVGREVAEIIRPPSRTSPSSAVAQHLRNDKGGWDPTVAPMMAEPVDMLASRDYQGIVFVGPSRSSKTFGLVLGGIAYVVTCAPGDTLITQMSQDAARDFSRTDLDRVIRHSPAVGMRLSTRSRDDNTYDKFFRSGMVLKLGWPAVSQLSSRTFKYVLLTDYDRPWNRDDVDGEGPMWDLAMKRVQTFMSRGKCLAESSPGEDYLDPRWKPTTPHEAPPARGIAAIYNRGTRARWYWPCMHCNARFEARPGFDVFALPSVAQLEKRVLTADLVALAEEYARVPCPHCGALHEPDSKQALNEAGAWLHAGERFTKTGKVTGKRRRSSIASYWLGGVAAAYQRWDSIVLKYLQALQAFVTLSDESPLRAVTNTDAGWCYVPRSIGEKRSAEALEQRAEEWVKRTVPDGVRFLTAAVDVQKHRFVVQVIGWGVGLESWYVDRFDLAVSRRHDEERAEAVNPAAYGEDWLLLIDEVIERTYPVEGLDLRVPIRLVLCDSGGAAGVTDKAYSFWRLLRAKGMQGRLCLVKGDGRINAARVKRVLPDNRGRPDRKVRAEGDVPVWMLNSNLLKDAIAGELAREEPGAGYVHFPEWIREEYPEVFRELTAETRGDKGWVRPRGTPNEAFDLHAYNRAGIVILKADKIDWSKPPPWARPLQEVKPAPVRQVAPPRHRRRTRSSGVQL